VSGLCSPRRVYCGNGEHVETPIGIKCGDRTGFTRPRATGQRSRGSATWSTLVLLTVSKRFTSICEHIPGDPVTFVLAMLFGDDLLSSCETVNIVSRVSFHTISLAVPHVPGWIFRFMNIQMPALWCVRLFTYFLLHDLKESLLQRWTGISRLFIWLTLSKQQGDVFLCFGQSAGFLSL